MINGQSVLAIVPARGGSKGIPYKNICQLKGKPLIAWTIEEAHKSAYIDRLILSSDDQKIIEVAREYRCEVPFVRPKELARDDTPGTDPVTHAIQALERKYDIVVLLQPTSPLRTVTDIDGCIEFYSQKQANVCVSVCESHKPPFWMFFLDDRGIMRSILSGGERITRRQDFPKSYVINGAVYVASIPWFLEYKRFLTDETIAYVMKQENSIDIDSDIDFEIAGALIEKRKKDGKED